MFLAVELVKEHQKGDTDCQNLALWMHARPSPMHADLQSSSPYLRVLARFASQHFDRFAKLDEMLVLSGD